MFLQQLSPLNHPTRFLHRTTQPLNIARPRNMTIYKKWVSFYMKSTLFHLQEKEKDCTTRKHLTVYFPKQLIRTQAVCSQVRVNAASRPGILCLNLIIRSWKLESLLFSRVMWNSCHQRKKPSQLAAPFYSFDKQKQKNLFLFWIHVSFHSKRSFFSSPKNKHKQNTAIKFHYYAYEDESILTKDKNTVVFSSSWTFHSFFMFSQSICKSK